MQWLLSLAVASVAAALKTDASIQTSVGFSAPLPPTVYRTGTALLQQWQVEALARREQTAVTAVQSQQKAIEAIATEQKNQNDQQTTFQSQLRQVEVKERQLEDLLQRQTEELQVAQAEKRKAEVMLQEQSQAFLRARSLQVAVNNALEFGNDILRDQLLGAAVYFIFMMIMAKVYGMAFTYPYPKLHREPTVNRDHFTFSLFECCNWDPDAPSREAMRDRRIPCCSCCCGPIRWADTASSGKTKLVAFWPAAILAVAMNALAGVSFFITGFIFILIATLHRQQIRKVYGMPHGSCGNCTEDLCTWFWCSCCATMQEAMEIEYIDPPSKPWQQSMVESLMPSALQTSPSSSGRQERTACC